MCFPSKAIHIKYFAFVPNVELLASLSSLPLLLRVYQAQAILCAYETHWNEQTVYYRTRSPSAQKKNPFHVVSFHIERVYVCVRRLSMNALYK